MRQVTEEKIKNWLLGLSLLSWAIMGVVKDFDHLSAPRLTISVLNAWLGLLFIIRSPLQRGGSNVEFAKCLPSFILGGMSIHLAGPLHEWAIGPQVLFVASGIWTIWSFAYLGRNFAFFPAFRSVTSRGPYRWLRHPAYAGELGLTWAATWAGEAALLWLLFCGCLVALLIRIRVEEVFLVRADEYRRYAEIVRWRLLPGVW